MTSPDAVEGGLEEPEGLEPAPGTLALTLAGRAATRADWERAAAAVLRKAGRLGEGDEDSAVWDRLARTTLDGIQVTPLGTPEDTGDLTTQGRPGRLGAWDVRTRARTNDEALDDLAHGATSLWVDADVDSLAALLDGVLLDLAPVVLATPSAARALVNLARERGQTLHAETNLGASALDEQAVDVARLAVEAGIRGVVVDATTVHDLGASDAQELGYALAVGTAYLRAAEAAGLATADAFGVLEFRYAATDEQFPTIAKLRAARRLWTRVAEICAEPAAEQRQHAVTSRPMLSRYDPWVNILRATIAVFAAGVGGADAVTVVPFDSPLGVPDTLGRRIARNTSSLLIAESHVAAVIDPAGGAHAVERLTDDLARAGWAEFQRIEESGGVAAALADGSVAARIAEVVARRDEQVARRTRPITGLSEFPQLGETLPERDADPDVDAVRRYGATFEALRDEPAARPVFVATLGTVAEHTARAMFATNLLAAGGIAVESAAGHDGQPVVCVCGTDAAYAEHGAEVAAVLRDGGADWVIVAGRPTDWSDDSCALGVDAVAFLTRTREKLR
jgi:methylmalonyl-CoA mutase